MKRPQRSRAEQFNELPAWVLKATKEELEEMNKQDKPREVSHGERN